MGLQSQLLGSLPTMATLVTSFLLLLVILGNNQASPDSNGDIEDLYEADSNGDIEDLYEAEPLTLKTQKSDNDAQWMDNYDSNVDWADARQDFNPQFVGKHKGK